MNDSEIFKSRPGIYHAAHADFWNFRTDGPESELDTIFRGINQSITSMFKMSIFIRNPTPRDRYTKGTSLNPYDTAYDIDHVYEKFPKLRSRPLLIIKSGKAVTRRRERLRYNEQHHKKLAEEPALSSGTMLERPPQTPQHLDKGEAEVEIGVTHPFALDSGVLQWSSRLASTKATTFVVNHLEDLQLEAALDRSETSYITSVGEEATANERKIPDQPKALARGEHFECSLCFKIQKTMSDKKWR